MRQWVASQCGIDQFEFYKIQAIACPSDHHLNFIRPLLKLENSKSSSSSSSSSSKKRAREVDTNPTSTAPPNPIPIPVPATPTPSSSNSSRRVSFPLLSTLLSAIPLVSSLTGFNRKTVESPVSTPINLPQETGTESPGVKTSPTGSSSDSPNQTQLQPNQRVSRRVQGLGIRTKDAVYNLEQLQQYIRLEGGTVGHSHCMWADNFAYMIIGNMLKLTILLIDMERKKSCLPYRYLHKYELKSNEKQEDIRYIVLKRTGPAGHFQYVQQYITPGSCLGSPRSDCSSGNTNTNTNQFKSVFQSHELPDVFRSLWGLDS